MISACIHQKSNKELVYVFTHIYIYVKNVGSRQLYSTLELVGSTLLRPHGLPRTHPAFASSRAERAGPLSMRCPKLSALKVQSIGSKQLCFTLLLAGRFYTSKASWPSRTHPPLPVPSALKGSSRHRSRRAEAGIFVRRN